MKDFKYFFEQQLKQLEEDLSQKKKIFAELNTINNNDPHIKLVNNSFAKMSAQLQEQMEHYDYSFLQDIITYSNSNYNMISPYSIVVESISNLDKIKKPINISGKEKIIADTHYMGQKKSYEFDLIAAPIIPLEIKNIFVDREKNHIVIQFNSKENISLLNISSVRLYINNKSNRDVLLYSLLRNSHRTVIYYNEKTLTAPLKWDFRYNINQIFNNSNPLLFFRSYFENIESIYFFSIDIPKDINDNKFSIYIPIDNTISELSADSFKINCFMAFNQQHRLSIPFTIEAGKYNYPLLTLESNSLIQYVSEVFILENNKRLSLYNNNDYNNNLGFSIKHFNNSTELIINDKEQQLDYIGKTMAAKIVTINNELDEYADYNNMNVYWSSQGEIKKSQIITADKRKIKASNYTRLLKYISYNFYANSNNIWKIIQNWIDLYELYDYDSSLKKLNNIEYTTDIKYEYFNNIPCNILGYKLKVFLSYEDVQIINELYVFKEFIQYYIPYNSFINIEIIIKNNTIILE